MRWVTKIFHECDAFILTASNIVSPSSERVWLSPGLQEVAMCPQRAATNLEVAALGLEPVLDVALGISGEAEHEVPLNLQLVDGLDGLVDLTQEPRQCREKQAQ